VRAITVRARAIVVPAHPEIHLAPAGSDLALARNETLGTNPDRADGRVDKLLGFQAVAP
jgi:hypothetical protein